MSAGPFLTINPSARSAGMGNIGMASNNGSNSLHFNASLLAFSEKDYGFSANYVSGYNDFTDINTVYVSGFRKLKQNTLAVSLRSYRSELQIGLPGIKIKESEFLFSYIRQLSNSIIRRIEYKIYFIGYRQRNKNHI